MLQLEFSRNYHSRVVVPTLSAKLPEALEICAFVDFFGDSGSFGWDDGLSHEDPWGPRVMAILPDDRLQDLGGRVREIALEMPARLPDEGGAIPDSGRRSNISDDGRPDVIVRGISQHFVYGDPPTEPVDWLHIDENRVFTTVSGAILNDPRGRFVSSLARWRRAYFPEDVWRRRLGEAVRATAAMIRSSDRLFARQESVTMAFSVGTALQNAMHVVFLLNREWTPPYKWRHRAFKALPDVAAGLREPLERVATAEQPLERIGALWTLNDRLGRVLLERDLSTSGDDLAGAALDIESRIVDPALRVAASQDRD